MKNNILKNLMILLITISMLTNIDIVTFAEASIIYAPTTAPKNIEASNTNDDTVSSENENIYDGTYEHSDSTDYDNIHLMVEVDDEYYCLENDTFAKKAWRKIDKSSFIYYGISTDGFNDDYIWMYFQSNGRAIRASSGKFKKIKIDGYYFAFNEYGQMLTGFFNDDGEMWNGNNDNLIDVITSTDNFYYADPKDGTLYTGWLAISNDTDEYEKKDILYFYFKPSSYKAVHSTGSTYKTETIGGKKYAFDDKGILLTGFEAFEYNAENGVSDTSIKYFGDDGALSEGFIKAIPSEELDSEGYEDNEEITYYLGSSGTLYKNIIKKIGNSYYGFDDKGAMITGLSVWNNKGYVATIDTELTDGKDFLIYGKYTTKDDTVRTFNKNTETIHYFNKNGKRVVSNTTIEFEDNPYTYNASNNGAYNGYKDKKFYQNGLLQKSTEDKYAICIENKTKSNYSLSEICGASNVYVVNKNGSKVTSRNGQRDDDDHYWLVNSSGNLLNIYNIDVKYSGGRYYFKSDTSSSDSEKWIEFGTPDRYGKTCVLEYTANGTRLANGATTSYQIRPDKEYCLNFILN